ncbi:hypothetical protein QFC20_000871 [Naganishia adeliensis]|uniref:Uncharacterized protein n=1 Tax=Naganishia adeliensis TaxID=92952 RepID=A0ACC2WYI1_9TREE|nr:hypothetical protein QFC20_000871 [Naganishia adeliensis]
MLLRLVPTPFEANPQPPTILFTLPMPNQPYTAKGLPLPSQLLTHRNVCLQQGIECSNPLLGDKASWLFGAIAEVTFVTSTSQILVQMQDSTEHWLDLSPACMAQCDKVIEQVTLSFAPVPQSGRVAPLSPPTSPISHVRQKSSLSGSFLDGRRQSPSSLLMSLLSPLIAPASSSSSDGSEGMFSAQQSSASHQGRPTARLSAQRATNPAKFHRRLARSMLVDTFRQFVLPRLKETLPSSYLSYTIDADQSRKQEEWNKLQGEIEALLERVSYQRSESAVPSVLRRPSLGPRGNASINVNRVGENAIRSSESSSLTSSSSSSTIKPETITSLAPAMYIATLPPYTELPSNVRITYATMHRRINDFSSLEACELEKNERRGIRRACSIGSISPIHHHLRPIRPSALRHSVFPEVDEERSSTRSFISSFETAGRVDEFARGINVRSISPSLVQSTMSDSEDSSDEEDDEELLTRQEIAVAFADFCISSPPTLVYNRSAESLESDNESIESIESPASLSSCGNEDQEDEGAVFVCPTTPRLGSVSQLSTSVKVDLPRPAPSVLRRFSVDSIDPLMQISGELEEEHETPQHAGFFPDMLGTRRKSEGLPFASYEHHAVAF